MPAAGPRERRACSARTTAIEKGRYRIARILQGENWNPKLRAPLTQPGVDVKEGDYPPRGATARSSRATTTSSRLFARPRRQADGPHGRARCRREARSKQVTVVPVGVGGVAAPARRGWRTTGRRSTELSGGRVGYVYIPDTARRRASPTSTATTSPRSARTRSSSTSASTTAATSPTTSSNILEVARRRWARPRARARTSSLPQQAIFGPKVMIANQMSGSGGDALPWLFKNAKLGPLVGVRTWGGLVGIGGYPQLIDGGRDHGAALGALRHATASGRSRTTASRPTSRSSRTRRSCARATTPSSSAPSSSRSTSSRSHPRRSSFARHTRTTATASRRRYHDA